MAYKKLTIKFFIKKYNIIEITMDTSKLQMQNKQPAEFSLTVEQIFAWDTFLSKQPLQVLEGEIKLLAKTCREFVFNTQKEFIIFPNVNNYKRNFLLGLAFCLGLNNEIDGVGYVKNIKLIKPPQWKFDVNKISTRIDMYNYMAEMNKHDRPLNNNKKKLCSRCGKKLSRLNRSMVPLLCVECHADEYHY